MIKCKNTKINTIKRTKELRNEIIGRFELSCPWFRTGMMLKTKRDFRESLDKILEKYLENKGEK
jgi:hypothetical protein